VLFKILDVVETILDYATFSPYLACKIRLVSAYVSAVTAIPSTKCLVPLPSNLLERHACYL